RAAVDGDLAGGEGFESLGDEAGQEAADVFAAADGVERGDHAAAAVGEQHGGGVERVDERRHVAAGQRVQEASPERHRVRGVRRGGGGLGGQRAAGARQQLATGRLALTECARDL